MTNENKLLLRALRGDVCPSVPFWLMRQAGRYLPEYRDLRARKGGFLDMVYDPEAACEITMQPVRRFEMDGAILFSDILVIPQAMGQRLTFTAGEGPKLDPVRQEKDLDVLNVDHLDRTLSPIYQTLKNIRAGLIQEKFGHVATLGFAGAPWTIACYMVEGAGSRDFEHVKAAAFQSPAFFARLIGMIETAAIHYLSRQIESGAEAVQIFDSWAGVCDEKQFAEWVIEPTARIVSALKARYPGIPVIGFPRGAGVMARDYAVQTGVDAVGIDYTANIAWVREQISERGLTVQGNLDPVRLLAGGEALRDEAIRILKIFSGVPFIFNLGHGVIKETPPEHVAHLTQIIRDFQA
jgi:uroporphyrinogen decarboxylase